MFRESSYGSMGMTCGGNSSEQRESDFGGHINPFSIGDYSSLRN
jgi:hypothetical protein